MRTEPLSPIEIEVKMAQIIEAIEEALDAQREAGLKFAKANHAYRQAQAQAWARVRIDNPEATSDKMRGAWVDAQTDSEMYDRNVAETLHETARSVVRGLQTEAEILRSLARSSRDLVDSWHGSS